IDARSTYGGTIAIAGAAGLVMEASADLRAGATDTALGSGRVTLEATGGTLDLRGGTIDVAGGAGGKGRFRARQTGGHNGIAVGGLKATVIGAGSDGNAKAVLEGVAHYDVADYDGVSIDSVKSAAIADAATFASHAADILSDIPGGAGVSLVAGIDIRAE